MYKVDLKNIKDLRQIESKYSQKSGHINGMLYKAAALQGKDLIYLKLGQFNKSVGFYGIEPIIELINSRIGQMLALPVLDYGLIRQAIIIEGITYNTLVSVSKDYQKVVCKNNEIKSYSKLEVESLFQQGSKTGRWSTPIEMIEKLSLLKQIHKQFIYDYIICNMDRHGKNNEILINNQNKREIRLAPFFDNSLTILLQRQASGYAQSFHFNDRMPVNNFIGSNNLLDNVMSINSPVYIKRINKDSRKIIFQGLQSVTTRRFRDYTWEMLNSRIDSLSKLRNNNIILV